jgi:hypothetical protein
MTTGNAGSNITTPAQAGLGKPNLIKAMRLDGYQCAGLPCAIDHSSPRRTKKSSMLKSLAITGIVVAAVWVPASAAVWRPQGVGTMTETETSDSATPVAWVCGPRRCVWRPGWRGFVPRWVIWGPPHIVGCFYERRRRGWVEVCP